MSLALEFAGGKAVDVKYLKEITFIICTHHVTRCSSFQDINVWLSGEQATNQLDIKEVLPQLPLAINSVDVSGEHLVCGGDNEAFYYIPKLAL